MSQPICLESPDALPSEIVRQLAAHTELFRKNRHVERVLENRAVRTIADELNLYLSQRRILGYHCTKEPVSGFFEAHGLRRTDVRSHQLEFLEHFGARFSSIEIAEIKRAWEEYFEAGGQRKFRDGLVWACLSRSLVKSSGTHTFFKYFGGESIFMPLIHKKSIAEKLEAIGRPVVVEVSLPGDGVNARYEMAMAILSLHHINIRSDAHLYESEAYLKRGLQPEEVLKVTPFEDFHP